MIADKIGMCLALVTAVGFSVPALAQSSDPDAALRLEVSRKRIEPGEPLTITATSTSSVARDLDIYLIRKAVTENPSNVCGSAGGWTKLNSSPIQLGVPFNWTPTTANVGEYYIVGNLYGYPIASRMLLCTGAFSWSPQSCPNLLECNSTASKTVSVTTHDMERYWNMVPGNYWIYEGTNVHTGSTGRVRIEVERDTSICGLPAGRPVLITKSSPDAYWGTAFTSSQATRLMNNSSVRLWFTKYTQNCPIGDECYGFSAWPMYERAADCVDDGAWSGECHQLGTRWSTPMVGLTGGVPYFQSPLSLNDLSATYSTRNQFFYAGPHQTDPNNYCGPILNPAPYYTGITEAIAYDFVNTSNPNQYDYVGPALVVKQGEMGSSGGWRTREDWYLAKDVGLVRLDEKTLGIGTDYAPGRCGTTQCRCNDILNPVSGVDDDDCTMAHRIGAPRWSMGIKKWYAGTPLFAYVNWGGSATVAQGGSFTVGLLVNPYAADPTYEGLVETDRPFIAPNGSGLEASGGWDLWFDQSGAVQVNVGGNVPPGQYRARFRPSIRSSNSSNETISTPSTPDLPWSNEITVNVVAGS